MPKQASKRTLDALDYLPTPFNVLQTKLGIERKTLHDTLACLQRDGLAEIVYGQGWKRTERVMAQTQPTESTVQ